ncbi:unnamed protein product [Rotaria sp. Silwood1]|nr:unnamed protein product [Rotaria sp. Silwood1]CAF3657102.1 unnamed protein product [Rotaria sp. Silwood1]
MPPTTLNMDITVLPPDVLSLYDESFYELVRKLAGPIEADLLELQGIRSAYSLIHTEDIFDILKYECKALDQIKKKACLLLDDNRYIIKPGCKSNLRYFTQLLNVKNQEHLKTIALRMKSKQTSNDDNNNNNNNTLTSQSSAQVLPTSSPLSPTTATGTTDQMNQKKHYDFLTQALDDWLLRNKLKLNLSNDKFMEGTDYKLSLFLNQGSEEAIILCSCGVRTNLAKERINFSLSNYYKHIKTSKCLMMKKKRKSISTNTNNEHSQSTQQQILATDTIDTSTTSSSRIDNNNSNTRLTSRKRTKSASYTDSSRKIRSRP